jgi:hypothetical protein
LCRRGSARSKTRRYTNPTARRSHYACAVTRPMTSAAVASASAAQRSAQCDPPDGPHA